MSKYAVIRIKNRQYLVKDGQEVLVDKLNSKSVKFDALLAVDEGKVRIGKPLVKGAKVKVKIVDDKVKGEKLKILKYKAKSRYRRQYGFRPVYSKVLIEKVT
jgi:large subunit ribosomal protein L21